MLLQQQQLRQQATTADVIRGTEASLSEARREPEGESRERRDSPTSPFGTDPSEVRYQRSPIHAIEIDGGDVTFSYGSAAHTFSGRGARDHIVPLVERLERPASVNELVANVDAPAEQATMRALEMLEQHGLVIRVPRDDVPHELLVTAHLATANQYDLTPSRRTVTDVLERLLHADVAVVGRGVVAEEAARLATTFGWSTHAEPLDAGAVNSSDFVIVAPDPDDDVNVAAVDPVALHLLDIGIPWTMVTPFDGQVVTVGPVVIGGETACHECARRRRTAATHLGADLHHLTGRTGASASNAAAAVAAGLAVHQVLRWVATADPTVPGHLSAYRPFSGTVSEHLVLRVPRCPVCGPMHPPRSPWTSLDR